MLDKRTLIGGAIVLCASVVRAAPLPDPVQKAVIEVYSVAPEEQATWLSQRPWKSVDVDGDGAPEFIVEVSRESGSDKEAMCTNEVFAGGASGYKEVFNFTCCDFAARAGTKGKGGSIKCKDAPKPETVVDWKGAWPKFDRSVTRSDENANFQQGMVLMRQRKFDEARKLLCDGPFIAGSGIAEHKEGCGAVSYFKKDFANAQTWFEAATAADPKFAHAYLSLGLLGEARGDKGQAIDNFKKYLALKPDAKERPEIEKKIAALSSPVAKPAPAPGGDALGPCDMGDCAAICAKLVQCKAGPFSSASDCQAACEGASEDPVASKTYRCVAKAKGCVPVAKCAR